MTNQKTTASIAAIAALAGSTVACSNQAPHYSKQDAAFLKDLSVPNALIGAASPEWITKHALKESDRPLSERLQQRQAQIEQAAATHPDGIPHTELDDIALTKHVEEGTLARLNLPTRQTGDAHDAELRKIRELYKKAQQGEVQTPIAQSAPPGLSPITIDGTCRVTVTPRGNSQSR